MNQEENCSYRCGYCGQMNEVVVDMTAGRTQVIVEDCFVCCRPSVLTLRIDVAADSVTIEAEYEG